MKATDLNRALNYVDDAYLMEADTPYKVIETESKEIKTMKDHFIIIFDTDDGQKEIQCTADELEQAKSEIKTLYGEFSINTISRTN